MVVSSEPLLGYRPRGTHQRLLLLPLTLAHVVLGTAERVCFARMSAAVLHGVVLIHTLLAALTAILFMMLRLARSQTSRAQVSPQLSQLRLAELVQMAVLDALHSLFIIDGAASITGIMQALLLQAALPMNQLLSMMTPPHQPRTSWFAGIAAALIAAAVCVLLLQNYIHLPFWFDSSRWAPPSKPRGLWPLILFANGDEATSDTDATPDTSSLLTGQLQFCAGVGFGVLSNEYKQRSLSLQPLDPLVLNSWLSLVQLLVGLILGPLLLRLIHEQPISSTWLHLSGALRCLAAGLSSGVTGDEGDAAPKFSANENCDDEQQQVPLLLLFFTACTAWNGISFLLLRYGSEPILNIGSAILLPTTILVFVRPVPLPYTWAAPPEPLDEFSATIACVIGAALVVFHVGAIFRNVMFRRDSVSSSRASLSARESSF
mmetsp:Transcript_8373/g.14074  ORF Transcript_8373/g.14074 Transcript_8373/m.14074 type:complete len:432 (+) Transcript_8373:161-1456(+)|eukprot:CAMPEP_0119303224 /NCGR_PEP_ID=MMETSP1333-20130426/4687_1 /TAXON_ID=418940 /ORGANISM="Scyphosphaera apsteinii, Strain RCC1455" /LENGTH=431 /DNA_ID=CAMNT_0007305835 /DNA_START=160 /DNA_END=1455 /DNA_ORIENTATION=+